MFLLATSPSNNKKPIPGTRSILDDLQFLKEAIPTEKFLLTDSRFNKYSSKIEDTRHIHSTYILLQIK